MSADEITDQERELEEKLLQIFLSGFQSGAVSAHMQFMSMIGAVRAPDDRVATVTALSWVHHYMQRFTSDPAVRAEICADVHAIFEGRDDDVGDYRYLEAHQLPEGGGQ